MSDIEEDFEEYNEEEDSVEFETDLEKNEETQLTEKVNENEEDIDDEDDEKDEDEEEDGDIENDEDNEDIENMLFNEKAKIKEDVSIENLEDESKRILEFKTKRLHDIKYMEFVALYSYRYGTLCRGGNALTEPVKDDIDETIIKEIIEGKSPMYIQKNNNYIQLKPDKAVLHHIETIRTYNNL
jgi:hypothetical protein